MTRTKQIIELKRSGMKNAEIARAVNCSSSNVTNTVERHGGQIKFRDNPLTPEMQRFIQSDAAANNVTFDEMARAMLADYVSEAMDSRES